MSILVEGYACSLYVDKEAGSFKDVTNQLESLAAAADNMAVALRGLRGMAFSALTIASNEERNEQWKKAGGSRLLQELEEFAKQAGIPPEVAGQSHKNGCLVTHYQHHEFTALAKFCRDEAKTYEGGKSLGLPTASRLLLGSPTMRLAQGCAVNLAPRGDLKRLNEIVRIVAELVRGKPQPKRFAERECQMVRRHTQTPQASTASPV